MTLFNSKTHWNLSSTILITFLIFLLFGVSQSVVLIICGLFQEMTHDKQLAYINLGIISSISSIVGMILIYAFIKIKRQKIKVYLNVYMPKIQILLSFIILLFFFMFGMEYISDIYPDIFYSDFVIDSYRQANSLPLFYLGIVFLGPIFEEFLFRGFLFKGLEKSNIGGHGAVVISAVFFSLVHIQYGIYILLFMMFPMALLLGYARLKSGSILLPILMHMINNLATCLITHFEVY